MRAVLNLLAPFVFVMTAWAQVVPSNEPTETADEQSGLCPTTHNLELAPSAKYWLEGSIGSKTVKMYLERGGSGVVGLFYEPNGDWRPVLLGGMWKPSGIDVSAGTDRAAFDPGTPAPIGRLQGQLIDNVFIGQWTPDGGAQSEPVRLSVVPKTGCEGKGAWKRFDSRKWPFSFSYPASWHLVEEQGGPGDSIRLVCPDPEEMAYNSDVTIQEGVGQPADKTGLVRCGNNWRFDADCGEYLKDSLYSHVAVQSVRHGMRILDISDTNGGHTVAMGAMLGKPRGQISLFCCEMAGSALRGLGMTLTLLGAFWTQFALTLQNNT